MRTPLGLVVGEDGVGIDNITSAYDASGNTAVTVALTDGSTRSFTVPKGEGATYETATQSDDGLMSAADKTKLDNIEAGAEANAIDGVQVNGTALSIAQKIVNLLIVSGASDGAISVNGADVAVTGLAALAYKAEVAYADLAAALKAVIDGHTADLSTLIGSDTGKSVRTIANEELAAQLIPQNAQEALDTLQEISAWIQSHPGEVADINRKLTLGTRNGTEYTTVKAYVEAMVSGLITLSALSANVTGAGNAITGVAYDNTNGAFSFTKGQTFLTEHQSLANYATKAELPTKVSDLTNDSGYLTQHQDISGKVDKVTGKGLSTNDYTNADKNKLSGIPADANHTTIDTTLTNAGQAADAKTAGDMLSALHNLISRMEIYCTASGNPATFSDADAANVKALSVTITPTQSGSGTPSPSNIRPISGVSSVTVTRTGKNRVPFRVPTNNAGLTFSDNSGNGILVNGTATYDYNSYSGSNPNGIQFVTLNPGRYTLSLENDLPDGFFVSVVNDDTSLPINVYYPNGRRLLGMDSGVKTSGFILQKTMAVGFWIYISRDTALSNYVLNPQLEAGYGATAREPYQGQTVTVTLTDGTNPLTVYGGTLDVTTGTLSATWANIASYAGETLPGRWISDRDVYAAGATPTAGAQVVYELAAPVTYTLTAQQLATLHGYNAVSADAGTLDVTYKANASLLYEALTYLILSLGGNTP